MPELLERISQAVYDGDSELASQLADEAIAAGLDAETVINQGGVTAMDRLGEDFDNLEVFLPELVMGGDAMKALIEKMTANLKGEGGFAGTVVIGCAKGDLHDIGKNLVATQLAVNGFKVYDMGTDVSVNKFVDKASEVNADIIAVSSLLTTSAYYQDELIKRLEMEGLQNRFKVIVGGGPITAAWTEKIGADGYSRTAHLAVELCKALMKGADKKPLIFE